MQTHTSGLTIRFGLHKILPVPILYGVKHTQGGSGKRHVLPNSRALRIAIMWATPVERGNTRMIDWCTNSMEVYEYHVKASTRWLLPGRRWLQDT